MSKGGLNDDGSWIQQYFHCNSCMPQRPEDVSPAEWARINVGWTVKGLQVWCVRCHKSIINLDFKEQKVSEIHEEI